MFGWDVSDQGIGFFVRGFGGGEKVLSEVVLTTTINVLLVIGISIIAEPLSISPTTSQRKPFTCTVVVHGL
jgi:hypothetical protein